LTAILVASLALSAEVSTEVSSSHISKGEQVIVSIVAKGQKIKFPTISRIDEYQTEGKSVSQSFSMNYINGKNTTLQTKTLSFGIFPDHNITIPSFTVEIDGAIQHTKPVKITVGGQSSSHSEGYRLQMTSAQKTIYTGSPVLVQVVFYEPANSNVAQAQYFAPKFDGFFVKSDAKESIKRIGSATAHIFNYILTPQKSGKLHITAPRIKIGIQTFNGTRDPWGFFSNEIHWRSIKANDLTINALKTPSKVDLVGSFHFKTHTDKTSTKINQPINYTFTIKGYGSLEDYEGPKFDIDGVTIYSDDPQVTTEIKKGRIYSKWVKKYTFIGDSDFTIPSKPIKVFDPKTKQTKTIDTRVYNIHILGSATRRQATQASPTLKPSNNTHTASRHTKHQTKSKNPQKSLLEDVDYYQQQKLEALHNQWSPWWILVSFVAGVLLTLLATKIKLPIPAKSIKRTKKHYTIHEALEILYPHTHDSAEIEQMVRELYKAQKDKSIQIDQNKLHKLIISTQTP